MGGEGFGVADLADGFAQEAVDAVVEPGEHGGFLFGGELVAGREALAVFARVVVAGEDHGGDGGPGGGAFLGKVGANGTFEGTSATLKDGGGLLVFFVDEFLAFEALGNASEDTGIAFAAQGDEHTSRAGDDSRAVAT